MKVICFLFYVVVAANAMGRPGGPDSPVPGVPGRRSGSSGEGVPGVSGRRLSSTYERELLKRLYAEAENTRENLVRSHMLSRQNGINDAEKNQILNKHNDLRRKENAADMDKLTWNDELARIATEWSAGCQFAHGNPTTSYEGYIGQNIYAGTEFNLDNYVQEWYNEIDDYDFGSNHCFNVCGHYTQVVWATTKELGCGYTFCPGMLSGYDAYFFVCNYGPGGNMQGEKPYHTGAPCSQCPEGGTCDNGLCQV